MSIQIISTVNIPGINSNSTDAKIGSIVSAIRRSVGYVPSIQAERDNQFYRVKPPAGINISELANQKISTIRHDSVRKQVTDLLSLIQEELNNDFYDVSNRLPKLHLTQEEDGSALIEWIFEYYRIGFSIEPDEKESSVYIVEIRKDEGIYNTQSQPLWAFVKKRLPSLIDAVIKNS